MYSKKIIFKNAWGKFKKQNVLTFAQCLKNEWTNAKIERLKRIVEGLKIVGAPFFAYKNETFKINDLKKQIIKSQSNFINIDVLDFAMF